jgi:biopolymer transport protein ExbD
MGGTFMRLAQRLKARIAADHKSDLYCHIDLTALLSIAFVLLTFFMTSSEAPHHGGPFGIVNLAKLSHSTAAPGALRNDALLVAIARDGQIYFGNDRVTPEQIPEVIRARLRNGAERKVYIGVDSRARYSAVEQVVDGVRLAGVAQITFIAQRDNQKTQLY